MFRFTLTRAGLCMERRLRAELAVDAGEREEAISCPAGVGAMMLCRG